MSETISMYVKAIDGYCIVSLKYKKVTGIIRLSIYEICMYNSNFFDFLKNNNPTPWLGLICRNLQQKTIRPYSRENEFGYSG